MFHCQKQSHQNQTATHCNMLQHTAIRCMTLQSMVRDDDVPLPKTRPSKLHCNTLQHVATRYNALQHTIFDDDVLLPKTKSSKPLCNTLQHTATHCNTLQHTAPHYNTLHHTAPHCITLHHAATHCTTMQHTATRCTTLQDAATHLPHRVRRRERHGKQPSMPITRLRCTQHVKRDRNLWKEIAKRDLETNKENHEHAHHSTEVHTTCQKRPRQCNETSIKDLKTSKEAKMYEKRRINTARQRAGYVHHLSEVHTICQKRPGCMTRDPYKRPKT